MGDSALFRHTVPKRDYIFLDKCESEWYYHGETADCVMELTLMCEL